ncbi:FmdE family protein [Desulfurococcus mucosus]|uniref:Formylmethanofuran dehydrogenase, subunit E n=1 Tax=Desulfurococcus mucosus (strain ATCC 35584 / DSM 2162 / JCM 9187 / O7/1) TaxID=765177 RepID=E8R8Y7_DESM0|nr:FmdE family protein [Desulfurococcus mucosus]ADV64963.1 formylmethanofuran dehydrogenase, subunit E [Desulfurococcus mucosus DSM 2162]
MVEMELIERAKWFHGHVCPFLVLGLRMSEIALEKLGVRRAGFRESLHEEILAIVEANNCLVDGVQVATGCTLGNNSLIYVDTGKNALTLVKRGLWKGVRIYVDHERFSRKYIPREASELFNKVVRERKGTPEEVEELRRRWEEVGLSVRNLPEEEFTVEYVEVEAIEPAPVYPSTRCSRCGELVMAPRAVEVNGHFLCKPCAELSVDAVVGRGIVRSIKYPVKR